jgi:hypothetical protein
MSSSLSIYLKEKNSTGQIALLQLPLALLQRTRMSGHWTVFLHQFNSSCKMHL